MLGGIFRFYADGLDLRQRHQHLTNCPASRYTHPFGTRPRRLAWSRTPAFHADNTGSNPVGVNFLYMAKHGYGK